VITGNDADDNPQKASPSGLKLTGYLQPPAILQLNKKIEAKYMSSSTGTVYMIKGKAIRLGVTYWRELEQQ